jgi:hypothetical protein
MFMLRIGIVLVCVLAVFSIGFLVISKPQQRPEIGSKVGNTPQESVNTYIKTAKNGNEDALLVLVTMTPDSYSHECERQNSPETPNVTKNVTQRKEIIHADSSNVLKRKDREETPDSNPNDKFATLANSGDITSIAFLEARNIFSFRTIIKEFKITSTVVLGDEAKVEVEYEYFNGLKKSVTFLLHFDHADQIWKIFMTTTDQSPKTTLNLNYAQTRPVCASE